jgi:transposase-like protein
MGKSIRPIREHNSFMPKHQRIQSLMLCPECKREMRVFGIEAESAKRDLYTFECDKCGHLAVRGVRVK